MPFDNFDSKIKEAADQHHPNYDETAWAKMEDLLDQHLPQKKNRRRGFIFFTLLGLLLGGGVWLIIDRYTTNVPLQKQNTASFKSQKENTPTIPVQPQTETSIDPVQTQEATVNPVDQKTSKSNPDVQQFEQVINEPVRGIKSPDAKTQVGNAPVIPGRPNVSGMNKNVNGNITSNLNHPVTGKKESVTIVLKDNNSPGNPSSNLGGIGRATPIAEREEKLLSSLLPAREEKNNPVHEVAIPLDAEASKKNVSKNTAHRKSNSIFFSVSAGPDVSSVAGGSMGKARLLAGAGFGVKIGDKWMLRTGFYSVSKIYSAKPSEYKPYIPPTNPTYLDRIDADCKVYEIPLSVAYKFSRSEKNKIFASLGLSSFLMKQEDYNYVYTYPGGIQYTHPYEFRNENSHYFSVMGISVVYERKVNKVISVAVEPYYKLPLAGVGNGNVKLNSAGVLVSINIAPFQALGKR